MLRPGVDQQHPRPSNQVATRATALLLYQEHREHGIAKEVAAAGANLRASARSTRAEHGTNVTSRQGGEGDVQ